MGENMINYDRTTAVYLANSAPDNVYDWLRNNWKLPDANDVFFKVEWMLSASG